MGLHKTTEHESGYFEDDDDEEDEGGMPVQFTPQQMHDKSDVVVLELDKRGEPPSKLGIRDDGGYLPICLEEGCWCFEGRAGNKGKKIQVDPSLPVICEKEVTGKKYLVCVPMK
ncbi:hypothetical protein RUM43_008552 [Polyplax serrata]|uniref:Uncharacterized protein n=1 Tax=Polyplax serrata TaxID=468196 RepID=A0AAN8PV53_POLSC